MKNKGIKKSVRDEILVEIALQYRENQKLEQKPQKVRLFEIWQKQKIPYSDFIDVILALESDDYLHYEKAGKNTQRAVIGNERVPQEFVTLEQKAKSFPETLSDEKENEKRLNLKYPIILAIITALIGILLSNASTNWLSQILEKFLSLFYS